MDFYNPAEVCRRIDAALQAKKMSRRELAKALGLAPSTFQSMMERKADFSLITLSRMTEILGIDPTLGMIGRTFIFQDDEERETEFQLVNTWRLASEEDRLVIAALMKRYGFIYPSSKGDLDLLYDRMKEAGDHGDD